MKPARLAGAWALRRLVASVPILGAVATLVTTTPRWRIAVTLEISTGSAIMRSFSGTAAWISSPNRSVKICRHPRCYESTQNRLEGETRITTSIKRLPAAARPHHGTHWTLGGFHPFRWLSPLSWVFLFARVGCEHVMLRVTSLQAFPRPPARFGHAVHAKQRIK